MLFPFIIIIITIMYIAQTQLYGHYWQVIGSGVTIAPAAPAGRGGAEHFGGARKEHLGAPRALITLIF